MPGTVVSASGSSPADLLEYARNQVAIHEESRRNPDSSSKEPANEDDLTSFNFGGRKLKELPDELVDVIKGCASRIALDRNALRSLSAFGPRITEFTRLKYLVLRYNQLEEFPRPLLDCPDLEYLDLRDNNIRELPSDLNRLTSIKVISVKNNQIRRLPLCIGQMASLHFMTTSRNPIEFPDKKEWRLEARLSGGEDTGDKRFLVAETTKLKKVLQKHAASTPSQTPESSNEVSTDTTRPQKSSRSGRFPIRPSMSSVTLETAPQASPSQTRPPLSSSRTITRVPSAAAGGPRRPSLDPLAASDADRHRSNSESQMSTSKSRKRMGMQVSRGGNGSAEMLDIDSVHGDADSFNHSRDMSTSSFLSNAMSVEGTDSSASPSTPPMFDTRENTTTRLSSLPENKRKSQYVDPFVELAQSITFSVDQLENPVRRAVDAIKRSNYRQRDLQRGVHALFTSKKDLSNMLEQLGIHDEGEEPESRPINSSFKAMGSIGDGCERCMVSMKKLIECLQMHALLVLEHTDARFVRLLMHMLFAAAAEVQNAYKTFSSSASTQPATGRPGRLAALATTASDRTASPSPRPPTSLRIENPSKLVPNGDVHAYFAQKPLPSPRFRGGEKIKTKAPSQGAIKTTEPRQVSVSSVMSPASSFVSAGSTVIEPDDPDQAFEGIRRRLSGMVEAALSALPVCYSLLQDSRQKYPAKLHSLPVGGRLETYDLLLHLCNHELLLAQDLGSRLQNMSAREEQGRNQSDFWQLCTTMVEAHREFAKAVQVQIPLLGLPDSIRSRMRSLHQMTKEVTHAINNSTWKSLARLGPSVSTPQSATWSMNTTFSPTASLYSPSSNPPSAVMLRSGRMGGKKLTINSSISSMASQGGSGSGYTTPLPATPISAALGPAAQATLGESLGVPPPNGSHVNGLPFSPMAHGHDLSVASLSGMPGWYTPATESFTSAPISHTTNLSIQQPAMNRSASSASIRSMGQRPPVGVARSVSQRR